MFSGGQICLLDTWQQREREPIWQYSTALGQKSFNLHIFISHLFHSAAPLLIPQVFLVQFYFFLCLSEIPLPFLKDVLDRDLCCHHRDSYQGDEAVAWREDSEACWEEDDRDCGKAGDGRDMNEGLWWKKTWERMASREKVGYYWTNGKVSS